MGLDRVKDVLIDPLTVRSLAVYSSIRVYVAVYHTNQSPPGVGDTYS